MAKNTTATATIKTEAATIIAKGWHEVLAYWGKDTTNEVRWIKSKKSGIGAQVTFTKITDKKGAKLVVSLNPFNGQVNASWRTEDGQYTKGEPIIAKGFTKPLTVWNIGLNNNGKLVELPTDYEVAEPEENTQSFDL